jgi:hypothetical protein
MFRFVVSLTLTRVIAVPEPSVAKPGVERWAIKTSTLANATRHSIDLADLLELPQPEIPDGFPVKTKRIPKSANDNGLAEGDTVTVKGWLHLVAAETGASGDEDYHIQISDRRTDGGNCVIVEAPNPDYIKNQNLKKQSAAIRGPSARSA